MGFGELVIFLDALPKDWMNDSTRAEVDVVRSLFHTAVPEGQRDIYLMATRERLEILKKWRVNDERVSFEPFMRKEGTFEDITHETFSAAARRLIRSKEIVECIMHPVAKTVMIAWHNMTEVAKKHSEQNCDDCVAQHD